MHELIIDGGVITAAAIAYHYGRAYLASKNERIVEAYRDARVALLGKADALRAEADRLEDLVA